MISELAKARNNYLFPSVLEFVEEEGGVRNSIYEAAVDSFDTMKWLGVRMGLETAQRVLWDAKTPDEAAHTIDLLATYITRERY